MRHGQWSGRGNRRSSGHRVSLLLGQELLAGSLRPACTQSLFRAGGSGRSSPSHSRPLPAPEARAEVETYTPLAPRVNTRKIIPFAKSRSFVEGWIARPSRPSKHERSNTGIEPDETSSVTPSAGPGNV